MQRGHPAALAAADRSEQCSYAFSPVTMMPLKWLAIFKSAMVM